MDITKQQLNDAMQTKVVEKAIADNLGQVVAKSALQSLNNVVTKSAKRAGEIIAKSGGTEGTNIDPTTGLQPDANGVGTVAALRRESLDNKVRSTTYGNEQFSFYWKMMQLAIPAHQTVEQYTLFDRHSQVGHGLTNAEGMISRPTDPHMTRKFVPMKYLSNTNNVSIQAALSDNLQDPMEVYSDDAITQMIGTIEWECYYGDADLSASPEPKNGTEFDGLIKLIPKQNVIDNGGKPLTPDALLKATMTITNAQGRPTDAFMPAGVKAQFVSQVIDSGAITQTGLRDMNNNDYDFGFTISNYTLPQNGAKIALNGSNVMNIPEQLNTELVGTAGNGLTPKLVSQEVKHNDGGKFRQSEIKTLNYKFIATVGVNQTTALDVAQEVSAADDSVDIDIKLPATGADIADLVTVYRQADDGFFWAIKRIGVREADDKGVIHFVDRNEKIAGTFDVFVGEMTNNAIGLYQLLPLDVLPLAQFNATYTWTYLWFGALALFNPKRWVRIKNVAAITSEFPH